MQFIKYSWVKIFSICVFMLFSSNKGFAQGPGWTVTSTVQKVIVTINGGVNVRLTPELTGCTSQSGYGPLYASIYPDHPGINRIEAQLLAAYSTGAQVTLFLSDSSCKVSEVIIGGSF
ncbi:MAG: hypothetical protein V4525_08085 [Pseudomonadota bacterium]